MNPISVTQEALLHRETYVAILNSLLSKPGSKTKLSKQANITPVYLSYLLALDQAPYSTSTNPIMRTPSPKVAQRIVKAIEAPNDIKENLLEHMILANETNILASRLTQTKILGNDLNKTIDDIKQLYRQDRLNFDLVIAGNRIRLVLKMAKMALSQVSPETAPQEFAQLCSLIYLTQLSLNRPDDGLWHIKKARIVLETMYPGKYSKQRENFDTLLMLIFKNEAHSYYMLGQPKIAIRLFEKAQESRAFQQNSAYWIPVLAGKRISAIRSLSRFSITEIENIAYNGFEFYEQGKVEDSYIHELITLELARSYIKHKNFKKAKKCFVKQIDQINRITNKIGIDFKIRLLRAIANFYASQKDMISWRHFIFEARDLAKQDDYKHQKARIETEIRFFKESKDQ